MKVSIAQFNPHLGNFSKNKEKIRIAIRCAIEDNSSILILPYGAISGFPQGQLTTYDDFQKKISIEMEDLALETRNTELSVFSEGREVLSDGKVNYDQFATEVYDPKHHPLPEIFNKKNMDIFVNLGPKVFEKNRPEAHELELKILAQEKKAWVFDINLAGAADELIFTGLSSITNPDGKIVTRLKYTEEDFITVDLDEPDKNYPIADIPAGEEILRKSITQGIKDYFYKNNFENILISVSGGIDSALVATLATEAIGAEKISAIYMPSQYSATISQEDAEQLCQNLNIPLRIIEINTLHKEFQNELSFLPNGVWNENIQARIRGSIVMSIANANNSLVLTTGNKSESAMGYCTLYGDTCGGLAPIADLLKTEVRALCRYLNNSYGKDIIPERTITRAPSAELRENQEDEQSLPNYEFLDQVLFLHCEEGLGMPEIIKQLQREDDIKIIFTKLYQNSYKRRQSAPGIKVSKRYFGLDWHIPTTVYPWFNNKSLD